MKGVTALDHSRIIKEVTQALVGKPCWYVSHGGMTSPSFNLALGEKVLRSVSSENPAHPEEYRLYEGESNLLVWCVWRLDDEFRPLASADQSEERIGVALNCLIGAMIEDAQVELPGWDLDLWFSNGLRLRIICDHVDETSSFDGNWELWRKQHAVIVGRGSSVEIYPRNREI